MAGRKKVFVVDRATWGHGGSRGVYSKAWQKEGYPHEAVSIDPMLLEPATKTLCCLGFVANQCGVPKKALLNVGMPEDIGSHEEKLEGVLISTLETEFPRNNTLAVEAQTINDDDRITNKQREEKLKEVFKKHGFTLRFAGKYPTKPFTIR